jgi:TRAP-type C4-dicarboxylate transport system permease small subunit
MDGGITDRLVRLNGRATLWLAYISALILALLAVVTFCDVVGRYVFNVPFTFTVELTELAMGLIVYLAIGLTTHEDGHISVDFVTLRLSEWLRALMAVITNILALAFLALMIWRLWLRAGEHLAKGDITQVWHLSIWPVAYVMAFGSVFLLTGVFVHLFGAVRRVSGQSKSS